MNKVLLLSAFSLVVFFSSCGDEEVDITPPSMKIISLSPAPVSAEICGTAEDTVFLLRGGENLSFELLFRDESSLSQYKIDIHNNFDCHGHGGGAAPGISIPNVNNQTTDWSELEITGLSGQEQQVAQTLVAPENITAGNYHFQIQVIDEAGNDNPLANFYSIQAVNPNDEEPPAISVNAPAGTSLSIAKGEVITFEGEVTDNYSLSEGGNGVLFLSYTDLSSGNSFVTDAVFPFDNSASKSYPFSFSYTIPGTLKAGSYRFFLRAHDGVRNVAEAVAFEVGITD
ncbi:MAG: DUF4625 domain-containing protein [Lewinellaceae bacterium]|nr:DUF4625 domain-containing protein [Lewinellaceae bacterium]MCB9295706.1 DUF4625 domain-containing protein [Lewinellaceae bacterium]